MKIEEVLTIEERDRLLALCMVPYTEQQLNRTLTIED